MDRIEGKTLALTLLKKYGYVALVLLVGIMLMLLPEKQESTAPAAVSQQPEQMTLQQELETLLGRLDGAGRVRVLLTESAGSRIHYQMDTDTSRMSDSTDSRNQTVILTKADRSQSGLVQRTDPPIYLGAVVLCQGADSAAVRLAVVEVVGTATGLTSDKIAVLKMK